KRLYGKKSEDKKNYDLIVVIMVNLGKVPSKHRLLRFLRLIFLDERKAAEKKKILQDEYDLTLTKTMEGAWVKMDSLAAGIEERGILKGEKRGEKRGEDRLMAALRMLKKNLPLETIMEKTGLTLQRLTELKAMF
ncbi:MAG: hypothetical protein ACTTH3_08850, partial [Schwartzia sp. (in: firmicutes)]